MSLSVPEQFSLAIPQTLGQHPPVCCTALGPPHPTPELPICLFLYGGGGSAQTLLELRPALERWWVDGEVPPMLLASAEVGPYSFYLDDPATGTRWETVVAELLLEGLAATTGVRPRPEATGLLGISMGGYGALKIALARPGAFGAVAAIHPMVEPGLHPAQVGARNRFHYPPEVPARLLGRDRDPALFEGDHPAGRAIENASALRGSGLSIYLEAGTDDAFNAADGAEFVHRVLWSLDLPHEYRLRLGADHCGPTLLPRLREALAWLGGELQAPALPLGSLERAWARWIEAGMNGEPPPEPLPPTSAVFPRLLRAHTKAARETAAAEDPTTGRHFGVLPEPTRPVDAR